MVKDVPSRPVDALLALPDNTIARADEEYLTKHRLNERFGELLKDICMQAPPQPLRFMHDWFKYGSQEAVQDKNGFAERRRRLAEQLFEKLQTGGGKMAFQVRDVPLAHHVKKAGGEALGDDTLAQLFAEFKPSHIFDITLPELCAFLAHAAGNLSDEKFWKLLHSLTPPH